MSKRDSLAATLILLCGMQGGASMTYLAFGVCVFVGIWLFCVSGRVGWRWSALSGGRKTALGLLAFYVVVACSVMAIQRVDSLRSWGELKWLLFFLVFVVLFAPVFATPGWGMDRRVKSWTWALLALTAVSSFAAIYQFVTHEDPFRDFFSQSPTVNPKRGHGMLRNPVPFGKLMGALAFVYLSFFLVFPKKKHLAGVLSGSGAAVCFIAVIASQSRGVWLSIGCLAVAALIFLPKGLRKGWAICMAIVFFVFAVSIAGIPSLSNRAKTIASDTSHGSNRVRLEQWHANWVILKENPFGVGFDGNDRREEEVYAELGYELPPMRGHCHNEFLEIAVATGWPGLFCYLAFSLILFWLPLASLWGGGHDWEGRFLLLSSLLVQGFLHLAVFSDQMDTQSRMMMSIAWGLAFAGAGIRREGREFEKAGKIASTA